MIHSVIQRAAITKAIGSHLDLNIQTKTSDTYLTLPMESKVQGGRVYFDNKTTMSATRDSHSRCQAKLIQWRVAVVVEAFVLQSVNMSSTPLYNHTNKFLNMVIKACDSTIVLAVARLCAPATTATHSRVIRLRRVLTDLPPSGSSIDPASVAV